ncbi:DUF4408 domain-containing protein [Citrus sinensis]|uniref:DUF4408 domain-containing protein n=1 Tax=Citrus sinensis TaxID=2711 RepID=A0ACB8LGW1_CITSI|nr:DUF4408 domain-containing protein [Citrus sinensis]
MDSMKKIQKKGCYLYNLMLYSLTGLACSVFCCHAYSPKCIFIIANVIIAFLVGESNFMGSSGNSSSPATDLYDEYVRRSRTRLRARVAAQKIDEKKPHEQIVERSVKRVHQVKDVDKGKQTKVEQEKEKDDGDQEEPGLPAEELNKRVEEFIARVNKQRWLEERKLICCKA